jgi:uncharacterized protein
MGIPTRAECLELLGRVGVPAHIRRHSEAVARVAMELGNALVAQGACFDLALVEAAALLHDIGKARALETHADHGRLGAELLDGLGHEELGPAVRDHALLAAFEPGDAVTEALLVNYADKRVMHEAVVSLDVRFVDLADRYAHDASARDFLEKLLVRYTRLEAAIFENLPFGPGDVGAIRA